MNGVGPATSKAITREFDSLDDLRESERARLESVCGVGDETAETILDRVQ
ncbi:helix-hairpin-helix domain-containing protein [Natrinema sp. CBA1119]|nr:helix-hairpin-helix domain-containing protein [Natrinema sp. CBA1119]